MRDWISVKTRLPETERKVLVWDKYDNKIIFSAYHSDFDYWSWGGYNPGKASITHWMDLPGPPP